MCGWNIYLTNIEEEHMTTEQIYETYSLRWTIELMFKHWKSNLKLDQLSFCSKTPNPARPEMLIYLMLLYAILVFRPTYYHIAKLIKKKYNKYLSPMKFSNYLNNNFDLSQDLTQPINLDLIARNCCYDKRSDRICFAQIFYKLISFG